jgi:hypothetical protein
MAWKTVEYAAFDDLDGLVATLERPLATALAGRPFGRAIFNIDPEKSEILVDGIVYAGNHPLFYNQGSFIATISAAGYRTASTRFAIVPGSDTFVKVRLEPVQSSPVFVESFPSGAVLYIDGAPLGTTPLQLSGAAYPRVLTTRMNGFDDLRVVVRPGPESERMVLDLQASDGLGYAERFKLAKGAFYQSLGWFIVSLPVTVLSYGTLNSYQSLLGSITLTDWSRMEDSLTLRFYGSQTVFWMSTAVSMGLATNSIVRLVRYIKAAR